MKFMPLLCARGRACPRAFRARALLSGGARSGRATLRQGWLVDQVDFSCPKCARPMQATLQQVMDLVRRNRARCQLCGTPYRFPPEVTTAIEGGSKFEGHDLDGQVEFSCGDC